MDLNADHCYRALVARDPRFDGVFFVGVTTTGIYCRPICPARTPGRARCRFFPSAAAAEQAGLRPCLRCRPELAPGHAPVDATSRLAQAAAARIRVGALNDGGNVETLAKELGFSSRQLRRALRQTLGVSPIELAQSNRLLLAKQLLTETRLPITQVAFASGFGSIRRFNKLFRSRYRLPPHQLRRRDTGTRGEALRLTLSYRPPFEWDRLLRFLEARACPGVEYVADSWYRRTVTLGAAVGWLQVRPVAGRNLLEVELSATLVPVLPALLARLRGLLDLDARPDVIASHLQDDPRIGPSVRRYPGLRVPGAFDGFELAVRAILGQQVSVRAATTLAGRLATNFGQPCETPFAEVNRLSASAKRIAEARRDDITALGIIGSRAEAILSLARALTTGALSLEPGPDPEASVRRLCELPGIGEWTAHYIAMRAMRWPDAFPHSDLGLRQSAGESSPRRLLEMAHAWRPWRAYAAMHLWNMSYPTGLNGEHHD